MSFSPEHLLRYIELAKDEISTSTSVYQESLDAKSIRLLRIKRDPAKSGVVHCTLRTFDLRKAPTFYALSYTWGPAEVPDDKNPTVGSENEKLVIHLNGLAHLVTPNLYDGLVQLRQSLSNVYYWVDALCVNQEDLHERMIQVDLMANIYSRAKTVVVWLGKDTWGDAEEVFGLTRQTASVYRKIWKIYDSPRRHEPEFEISAVLERYKLPSIGSNGWHRLVKLHRRRWFTRVWTRQEIALANDTILLCGGSQISWDDVDQCSRFVIRSGLSVSFDECMAIANPAVWSAVSQGFVASASRLRAMCNGSFATFGFNYGRLSKCLTGSPDMFRSMASVMSVLFQQARFDSTDARDHIYGMLGILRQIANVAGIAPLEITADYTKSPEDLFLEITRYILEETQFLGFLILAEGQTLRRQSLLPSWVPGYGAIFGAKPLNYLDNNAWAAFFDASSCGSSAERFFSIDGKLLDLRCFRLGLITEVASPVHSLVTAAHIESWASLALKCEVTYSNGQSRVEALWRTLVADTWRSQRPAPEILAMSFRSYIIATVLGGHMHASGARSLEKYLDSLPGIESLASTDNEQTIPSRVSILQASQLLENDPEKYKHIKKGVMDYHSIAGTSLCNRCLFRMDTGYIGLAPASAEVGDTIWIVAGAQTPFALRDAKTNAAVQDPTQRRRTTLVGEAYVHGVMFGEALDRPDFLWEDITLE